MLREKNRQVILNNLFQLYFYDIVWGDECCFIGRTGKTDGLAPVSFWAVANAVILEEI